MPRLSVWQFRAYRLAGRVLDVPVHRRARRLLAHDRRLAPGESVVRLEWMVLPDELARLRPAGEGRVA